MRVNLERILITGFIGVALLYLVLPAQALAGSKQLGNIIHDPVCPVLYPTCPADQIRRGMYKVSSSNNPGTNGLEFKIILSGVKLGGVRVNSPGAFAVIDLDIDLLGCATYVTPLFDIVNGRGKMLFSGQSLDPATLNRPGTSARLCGNGVTVYAEGIPFGIAGLYQGTGGATVGPGGGGGGGY